MEFEYRNRVYRIAYSIISIVQLDSESGVGKSLFCQDLNMVRGYDQVLRDNAYVINYKTRGMLNSLSSLASKYKTIVIDNADVILTDEAAQELIWVSVQKAKNNWIIIGRNTFKCVPFACRGVFVKKKQGEKTLFVVDYD
jgi:hypothetical protein